MSRIHGEKLRVGQADGSQVTLLVYGDEFYARYENEDGYTVVYDSDLGKFCYAVLLGGEFVSSRKAITAKPPSGLRRHLREEGHAIGPKFGRRFRMMVPPSQPGPPVPSVITWGPDKGLLEGPKIHQGKVKGVTVLVEFQDVPCSVTHEEISSMLNDDGYSDGGNFCSVREYFLKMSGGALDYSNEVYGPIKLKYKRSHYHYSQNNEVLLEALAALESQGIDFREFDSGGNGIIDAINIMYAGETQYIDRSWLWPHNFHIEVPVGDMRSYFYQICSLESRSIGTFCHENGHMLCRFPDLYDYGGRDNDYVKSSGLGTYCLMSAGNHLGEGRVPSPISAYFRFLAGWCTNVVSVNRSGIYEAVHGDYRTVFKYSLDDKLNEYFLIENRHQVDLDGHLISSGLAVYHCDVLGSNEWQQGTPSKHYQCALLQADGHKDLENGNNMGDSGDLFRNRNGEAISYETSPSSMRWDRSDSGLIVSDIGESEIEMSFRVG